MVLAPVTVLPMTLVLVVAHVVVGRGPALATVVAVVVLAAEALVTRAMHLDGLADTKIMIFDHNKGPAASNVAAVDVPTPAGPSIATMSPRGRSAMTGT